MVPLGETCCNGLMKASQSNKTNALFLEQLVDLIPQWAEVDAVYLYGSRAKGLVHAESDWDFAVLYRDWLTDKLEGVLRPQQLEARLQAELDCYDRLSIVDLERVPLPLQVNIVRGDKLYDSGRSHVRRVENAIASKWEIDYA